MFKAGELGELGGVLGSGEGLLLGCFLECHLDLGFGLEVFADLLLELCDFALLVYLVVFVDFLF